MARQLGNSPIWYQSRSIQYSRPAWREAPAMGIGWSNIRRKENCYGLRSISLHRRHHRSNVRQITCYTCNNEGPSTRELALIICTI
ncbi:ligatin [Iris pallida]|uniref:Ligatin n=1 Tax=Iris pallida TaxID=29817 RepID=A0AAX6DXI2_IRIPA|nr:ligatin [Iris pallida]